MKQPQFILTPRFLDQPLPGLEELIQTDWQTNLAAPEGTTEIRRITAIHAGLAALVEGAVKTGRRPVSIAGDCCTALGVLAGLGRSGIDPHLIWFDAHGDFNTWETTPSGFLGGMPLAMLAGLGEQTGLEILGIAPLAQQNIILTDARDLDPGERELLASSRISHLDNPLALLDKAPPEGPLWIHFDTDVIDPEYVPAQNYTAPGGITPHELGRIFSHLAENRNICAVSLSSWAPGLPGAEQSRDVCLGLLELLTT
jgi:arginase